MDDDLDVAGNFISQPALCKECGRTIAFRDKKVFDAKYVDDGVYKILLDSPHNLTCPVKIKARIKDRCPFCRLEQQKSILRLRDLFDYEWCEAHSDETVEVTYRGKTYKRDKKLLRLMYADALKNRQREKRKIKKGEGNVDLEAFLSNPEKEE